LKRFLLTSFGGFDWRKHVPVTILWLLYGILYLILASALGMLVAMFMGKFDMTREQIAETIPIFGSMMVFFSPPSSNHYFMLMSTAALASIAWLFSTRLKVSTSSLKRRMFFFSFAVLTFVVVFNVFASNYLKPISYDKVMMLDTLVEEEYREYIHAGALRLLGTFLMMIPAIVTYRFLVYVIGVYKEDKIVQDWFADYKFQWKYLARFGEELAMKYPDITLAIDATLRIPIVLMGASRQLGTMLIGPPGSGKTSLKIIKAVRQDLEHMQKMINAFPVLAKKHGIGSKEFQKEMGKYLIGQVVIEPAKDLCDKSHQLAKEHGIPDRLIVYLDPSNPNTPGFNCMIGPIEQVAETITAVLDGMSEVSNEFFRQACRTVLKQYIYLLKFSKKNECTLIDLDQMYQDPRFTKNMVENVRAKMPKPEDIKRMPSDMQIYWMLVFRTLRWFDNDGLEEEKDREGMLQRYTSGEYKGQIKIKDKQAEFTRQTRNLLADLITNPYLARILTGTNAVDLDKLMAKGGILLCNTDNGLLGNVSDAFGKLVLMSVQNAIFRRKGDEDTRSLVSIYVDEFYDYMNSPFLKLAGQGRKYKAAFLVACQSLSQFRVKFDESFVDAMIGTIRNYIVYGGVGQYDAKKLAPIFGTQVVEEVTVRENFTPENGAENPSYSYGQSVAREEKALVSEDEIMFNKFKFSYIRLVVEGSTTKALKGEGDFVDMGQSDKWKKALDPAAVKEFMQYWHNDEDMAYTFDMNWIDSWGELIDPNTKKLPSDLEQQIQFEQQAPDFEEVVKIESNGNRFFPLKETMKEIDQSSTIKEEEVALPRASQVIYGAKPHLKPITEAVAGGQSQSSQTEPNHRLKAFLDLDNTADSNQTPEVIPMKTEATPQKPQDIVNFSSLFGQPASTAKQKQEVSEKIASNSPVEGNRVDDPAPAHSMDNHEAKADTESVKQQGKRSRNMEYLRDAGVDANSKKFLQQLYGITKDTD